MSSDIQKLREIKLQEMLGLREGRRHHVVCPFHGDSNPSLVIYPNGTYYCFGCKAHGSNCIDFLVGTGMSFPEAIEELKNYTTGL